jgi:hypothetical protein
VAEWLGSALQKLLQRFESARDLDKLKPFEVIDLQGVFILNPHPFKNQRFYPTQPNVFLTEEP